MRLMEVLGGTFKLCLQVTPVSDFSIKIFHKFNLSNIFVALIWNFPVIHFKDVSIASATGDACEVIWSQ